METYPEIHFPSPISEIFNTLTFARPIRPLPPFQPVEEKQSLLFKIFYWTFFTLLIPPLGLVPGFIINDYLEKKRGERNMKLWNTYRSQLRFYENALAEYQSIMELSDEEFQKYEKKVRLNRYLQQSAPKEAWQDYNRGATHNYFKDYLMNAFGQEIYEDVTIAALRPGREYRIRDLNYLLTESRRYVPDFLYKDNENDIYIAIEIDEPYTLNGNIPIHINDDVRNYFFNNNMWTVIRFAEEQIVRYPDMCIALIYLVIGHLYGEYSQNEFNSYSTILNRVNKWDEESVQNLIRTNHRRMILSLINLNQ